MDIDNRIANGMYGRLVIPDTLKELISETFTKLTISPSNSTVRLGEQRGSGRFKDHMMKLIRTTIIDEEDEGEEQTYQVYFIQYMENDIDWDMFLLTSYDIPPESGDLWLTFPIGDPEIPTYYSSV